MRATDAFKLMAAVVAASIILVGCGGNSAQESPSASAANQPLNRAKPPLVVPAEFASEGAKREFGIKAALEGYYAEAKPILESSVAIEPNPQALSLLGTARYNANDYEGAIEAWSQTAQMNPAQAGEMANNIGNALRDLGKKGEAIASYQQALAIEPTRWSAAVNMAGLLYMDGKLDEGIRILEEAQKANTEVSILSEMLTNYRAELKP